MGKILIQEEGPPQEEEPPIASPVFDVLNFMAIFQNTTIDNQISAINNVITVLNTFNNLVSHQRSPKEELVPLVKEWRDKEFNQHPSRDDLHYYESFFKTIQKLALDAEDPTKTNQVICGINDAKGILEQEAEKLSRTLG